MEKEKAIEIFNKWMDCKDAYQADPSCDGNCFSCEYYASAEEEKEAMLLAISALEKQEQDRWIPVTERLPEYGQVVMWCNENGSVFSSAITYKRGDDWAIGKRHRYKKVLAWRPLPEPYQEDDA